MSLQRVQIVTVDPATRYVEFRLKDGAVVTTQVWEVPSFFRWPKEGEYWTVERTANTWKLGHRMEDLNTVKPVSEVAAGEAKVNVDRVIYTDDGARLAVVVGDPAEGDTVTWSVADDAWIPGAGSGGSLAVDFYNAPYDGPDDPTSFPGTTLIDFAAGGFNVEGFGGGEIFINSATKPFYLPYDFNYVGALPRPPLENSSGGITYMATGQILSGPVGGWDGMTPGPGTGDQTLAVTAFGSAIPLPIGSYFYVSRLTTGTVTVSNGGDSAWHFIVPGSLTPVSSFTVASLGGLVKVQRVTDALWVASGDVASGGTGGPEAEQSLEPYLGTGYYTYPGVTGFGTGTLAPQGARFYRDNGRVYFAGLITFDAGISGFNARIPIASMPAGYRPAFANSTYGQIVVIPAEVVNSPTAARQEFWEAQVTSGGQFLLNQNKNLAAASPTAYYPPDQTILVLEGISYRHA